MEQFIGLYGNNYSNTKVIYAAVCALPHYCHIYSVFVSFHSFVMKYGRVG